MIINSNCVHNDIQKFLGTVVYLQRQYYFCFSERKTMGERECDLPKGHTANIDKIDFQNEILASVKSKAKLTETTMGSHPRLLSWLDAAEGDWRENVLLECSWGILGLHAFIYSWMLSEYDMLLCPVIVLALTWWCSCLKIQQD